MVGVTMRTERIGDAVVILGDSREVMPTLGRVDAVVTDPPYGVDLKKKTSRYGTGGPVLAYEDTPEHVMPVVLEVLALARAMARCVVLTPGVRLLQHYPPADSIGTIFSPGAGGMDSWGFGCNNPVLFYGKCPYLASRAGSRPNSFASYAANPYEPTELGHGHPCPKPVAWMRWLVLRASASTGETVLDPFAGSGTTGVACAKLGRRFIGIEQEPKYFDIAVRRIEAAYAQPDLFVKAPEPKPEQLSLLGAAE
jgi:hypothetical protein